MLLYLTTCISYIASVVSKPLYMDKGTTHQLHLDFAHVCGKVDVEEEIEDTIEVDMGEE